MKSPRKSYLVSFIGMDGSGKTTTSENLLKDLKKQGYKVKYIYSGRGRNNILPIQFIGRNIKVESSVQERKIKKNSKTFSLIHTLAAPVFALDLFLRYHFKIKPLRKKYDFVITDRYSTDILLMNKVPSTLKRFLYFFFKKPEISFYLYNSPEELYKRKKHPLEDLKRQEKIFKKINSIVKPIKIKSENEKDTLLKIKKELNKKLK